jgi:hypothetical protein
MTVRNHGRAVDIATVYGLDDLGVGVRFPVESLIHIVQAASGTHPAFYTTGNRHSFTAGKAIGT